MVHLLATSSSAWRAEQLESNTLGGTCDERGFASTGEERGFARDGERGFASTGEERGFARDGERGFASTDRAARGFAEDLLMPAPLNRHQKVRTCPLVLAHPRLPCKQSHAR
jgi:hypothetical protein